MVNVPVDGLTVTASGWGTEISGGSQSAVLKKVDLPVIGSSKCREYYGRYITDNMICTYSPGSDTCQGDSGGSIDYKNKNNGRYYHLGIVSWGFGCAEINRPGVHVKMTNYLNWITAQTAGTTFCRP
ncbi:Trypsin-1 [Folsomia candida]|uniref:Trypsin-1 n=2 Tax=Folsomia candida TaxID=158441 RepID=A0A226DP90_FOLCA|nr:Trypsin-1 [Folsomia candida]